MAPTSLAAAAAARDLSDIFFQTFTATIPVTINAPLAKTLVTLRDPVAFTSLSELFESIDGPRSDGTFKVTEALPILDIFNATNSFDVKYTVNPDGLESFVMAPAGTQLHCKWVATDVGNNTTSVVETTEVRVS